MNTTYRRELPLPVSAEEAFAWHVRPGAFDRLIPPWESVTVLQRGEGIRDGSLVELAQRLGPLKAKRPGIPKPSSIPRHWRGSTPWYISRERTLQGLGGQRK